MTPLRTILLPLLLAPFLSAAPTYTFTLDGKPSEPRILPVLGEAKGQITEGDIAFLDDFTFVVGNPGRYELRLQGERDSELLCRIDGGPEHHLAVQILESYDGDDHRIDALAKLDTKQRKLLRGITLDVPTEDWATAFKSIDWTSTALAITKGIASKNHNHKLLRLPKALRYLDLQNRGSDDITDFSSLQELHNLRYASFYGFINSSLDLRLLRNAGQLRNLSLSGTDISHAEGLASLTELRFLKLRWTRTLDSVSFAAHMPALRVLKVDDTNITDLSPLNGLKHLRLLSATQTNVSSLPDGTTLPALREIRLLATPVADNAGALAAFQATAPDCLVKARWADTLHHALDGATKLRVVRFDFTKHPNVTEKVVFEIGNPDEINSLVKGIGIDEKNSGFHCMCTGDPFLDFYKDDTLITRVGFHHARSLRWSTGWPGDAMLTNESADLLCARMSDHGFTEPQQEREIAKASQRAEERSRKRYSDAVATLAPETWLTSIQALSETDLTTEAITKAEIATRMRKLTADQWPDERERAKALFTLYGAIPSRNWLAYPVLDEALHRHLLPTASAQVSTLLADGSPSDQLLQGISRWSFLHVDGHPGGSALAPAELTQLAKWSLSHPRGENRALTVLALHSEMGEPLLLKFLKAPPTVRALPEDQEFAPASRYRDYEPAHDAYLVGAPARAQAAFILAQRGCTAARPTIKTLTTTAPADHRPHYREALKILDEKAEK